MKNFAILFFVAFLGFFSGFAIPEKAQTFAQDTIEQEYQAHEFEESQEITLETVQVEASGTAEENPINSIAELIKNWKTMSPVAIGAAIILILIQLLKSNFFGQFFKHIELKRSLITILGVIYGVVYLVSAGSDWVTALVEGLS